MRLNRFELVDIIQFIRHFVLNKIRLVIVANFALNKPISTVECA